MFNFPKIKYFLLKLLFGLSFLAISVFIFTSLLSYNPSDQAFGVSNNDYTYLNLAGLPGAYCASILLVFLGYGSFLIPFFFLTLGGKLILNIKIKFFLLRVIFLITSIALLNTTISMINVNGGIFGSILYIQFYSFLGLYLEVKAIYWLLFFVLILLSLILIFLSFEIRLKLLKKPFFILKIIKYIFVLFLKLKPKFKEGSVNQLNINRLRKIKNKKSEPTLNKKPLSSKNETEFDKTKIKNPGEIEYVLPSANLLKSSNKKTSLSREIDKQNAEFSIKLEKILSEYGVEGKIINYKYGPVVTLFEFLPAAGVKTSKVVGLSEDITRAMSSLSTRIALQPGKTSLGIEIPNSTREEVLLGDLINNDGLFFENSGLILALGKDISGEKIYTDLEKMPHLLIAGTTGSGKSVGINSMIISLLLKFTPSECKLILIDPKMLELSIYEDIPHLLTPVVTNPNKAVFALKWVVREMENRYRLMSSLNVKNIKSFNSKISSTLSSGKKLYREVQTGIDADTRKPIIERREIPLENMPLIVVVIDEMADLMMVAGKEVESLVQRLAQMARASGIHLIAATQRPSVDVITGTIKANFPSRISFRVASRFDSRTILNEMGAEQLLGSGDMLFLENGATLNRLHGSYVSEKEIENIVSHIKSQSTFEILEDINLEEKNKDDNLGLQFTNKDVDELYEKALSIIIQQQKVSTSFIQRYLQIGYNRAARIVEKMEEDGYISEPNNSGKRSVLKKNK